MPSLKYGVAITGGIGTGKSSVSTIFRLYGYTIIDADKVAHQVLNDNTSSVVDLFSDDILGKDNKIDRKKLGEMVFGDYTQKKKLEDLLHPKIRDEILSQANQLESYSQHYFLDIPLFFEVGGKKTYDVAQVLLIYATKELQLKRIVARDGLSQEDAMKRIEAQMDIEEKKLQSENIIENTKGLKELQEEIEKFLQKLS